MERPGNKELRALLEFIKECYCIGHVENLPQLVISRLAKIVQSNIRRYNELGPPPIRKYRANGVHRGCSGSEAEPLARDIHKNPSCSHHTNNPEVAQKHSLKPRLDGKFHRTLHLRYQSSKNSKPNRRTNHFEKRNELLVERLTRYLLQSHRNTHTETRMQQKPIVLEHALNALNLGLVVLTAHAKIRLATPFAIQQMGKYFGQEDVDSNDLPQALRIWVNQQQLALKGKDEASLRADPLVLQHAGERLMVRVVFDLDQIVLLFEERLVTTKSGSVVSRGLSPRETQVLLWVSQGKTNKETGVILELSARTVQKHLEHIYRKLGVDSRTGAAAKAFEIASMAGKQTGMFFLVVISSLIT
jgi:DNA-binding CsgD family transcriptional regulator